VTLPYITNHTASDIMLLEFLVVETFSLGTELKKRSKAYGRYN